MYMISIFKLNHELKRLPYAYEKTKSIFRDMPCYTGPNFIKKLILLFQTMAAMKQQ